MLPGQATPETADDAPALSVIAPAHNEAENIAELVAQIGAALAAFARPAECIIIDDGSTDGTRAAVLALAADRPWLRCVAMQRTPPGKGNGQSAAFFAGIAASRGRLIATIDADLQNDPADIPRMIALMEAQDADFVQGDRSRNRKDSWFKRFSSRIGRAFRRLLLGDSVRDTGCSLRVMKRQIAEQLPLQFRGMHRFIPVYARALGFTVIETPVAHRARAAGATKYGSGIGRAIPGLVDCFAVRWMRSRRRPTAFAEAHPQRHVPAGSTPTPPAPTSPTAPRDAGQPREIHA